jgi:hypothetical protein
MRTTRSMKHRHWHPTPFPGREAIRRRPGRRASRAAFPRGRISPGDGPVDAARRSVSDTTLPFVAKGLPRCVAMVQMAIYYS